MDHGATPLALRRLQGTPRNPSREGGCRMSATETHNEKVRDLLGDIAWELGYQIKELDPKGTNRDWDEARKLVEKYKMLEEENT